MDRFTRREVNLALLASAMALIRGETPSLGRRATPLFDFAIAGGWFHGLRDCAASLEVGQSLELRVEPENLHDISAVGVHLAHGAKLGYVPRGANQPISRLLNDGVRVEAIIVGTLDVRGVADIPDDLVFTGFSTGDPRIRLTWS